SDRGLLLAARGSCQEFVAAPLTICFFAFSPTFTLLTIALRRLTSRKGSASARTHSGDSGWPHPAAFLNPSFDRRFGALPAGRALPTTRSPSQVAFERSGANPSRRPQRHPDHTVGA